MHYVSIHGFLIGSYFLVGRLAWRFNASLILIVFDPIILVGVVSKVTDLV